MTHKNTICMLEYYKKKFHKDFFLFFKFIKIGWKINAPYTTRGSVGWACVAHLSFCFEET